MEKKMKTLKEMIDFEKSLPNRIECKKCGYWQYKYSASWDKDFNYICPKCNCKKVEQISGTPHVD